MQALLADDGLEGDNPEKKEDDAADEDEVCISVLEYFSLPADDIILFHSIVTCSPR